MIRYPKPTDLSHLVDSRIGIPNYNPASLSTGIIINRGDTYEGFENASATGFRAISTGGADIAATPETINIVVGRKYIIQFYLVLNSGTLPDWALRPSQGAGDLIGEGFIGCVAGWNRKVFTVNATDSTSAMVWYNQSLAVDFTVSEFMLTEWSGEELIPDPDVGFVANNVSKWVVYGTNTKTQDGNAVKFSYVDNSSFAYLWLRPSTGTTFNSTNGHRIRVVARVKVSSGATVASTLYDTGNIDVKSHTNTDYEYVIYEADVSGADARIILYSANSGESIWIEILSVMKVTGLVAAYNMIPNGSTLVDISGNVYNGTIVGNGVTINKNGLRLPFGSYVDISPQINIENGGNTICMYFYYNPENDYQTLFESTYVRDFYIRKSDGYMRYYGYYNGGAWVQFPTATMPNIVGYYSFVLVAYPDSLLWELYVNGESYGTVAATYGNGIGVKHIGTDAPGPTELSFDGAMEDVRLFNYAFSEQEAIDYHNQFAKQISKKGNLTDFPVGSTI